MSENKTGKYLKYAIGEILLVVIGILIALQINNWNEHRKSANAEAKALVELLGEFKINYKDLLRVEDRKLSALRGTRRYLDFLNNDSIPNKEKNYIEGNFGGNTWNMTYSVLHGLINSGAINNLKNDSLRFLLNNWDGLKSNYIELQENYTNVSLNNLRDYLNDKMPRSVLLPDSTFSKWGNNYRYESKEEREQLAIKFVHDMKYQNLLKESIARLGLQLMGIQTLKQNHNKIVALLEEEINAKK